MKFIYKLIIGLVLFNSMLVIFSFFMPDVSTVDRQAEEYKEHDVRNLGVVEIISTILVPNWIGALIFLALLGIGLGGVLSGRSTPLYLGVAIGLGIFLSVLSNTIDVIMNLNENMGNDTIGALIGVLFICIGILALLSLSDILASRSDVN